MKFSWRLKPGPYPLPHSTSIYSVIIAQKCTVVVKIFFNYFNCCFFHFFFSHLIEILVQLVTIFFGKISFLSLQILSASFNQFLLQMKKLVAFIYESDNDELVFFI